MYCSPVESPVAIKPHKCHSCGEDIAQGERYKRWRCFDDGSVSSVKMHAECLQMHCDDSGGGYWEFMLFEHERPRKETA